jgi:peptide deformylase
MKLPLAYYGNPVLRKKAALIHEITDEIRQLAADMIETMHAENGIGLAAPQIHHSLAIFVTNVPHEDADGEWVDGEDRVYINPKILEISTDFCESKEGCLSIPKLFAIILRPCYIIVEALDLEGNRIERELSGLDAHNFLHENDHLNGVLFIDRLKPNERKRIETQLRMIKKKFNP